MEAQNISPNTLPN